ncbi:MMPL family transporter [Streptomyces sp. ISL-112]|uniref:MMPL family transporter n=1 Tax=unclassified Streptomyces TaxID=2593676 RepID=UPI001BEBEAEE|nr:MULTISPECIES: MMPL family transporter [unclassified Streptomyces]MBT2427485.1 MMPL family transporter [Streptomyces sp. ISL-112]MBT2464520.1 MMPL family transporter [Streptomyces sp. ISL-63]
MSVVVRRFTRPASLTMLLLWLVLAVATGPYTVRLGEVARAGPEVQLPAGAESAQVARLLNPSGVAEPLPLAVVWTPRQKGERITPGQEAAAREVTARLAGPSLVPVLAKDSRALIVVVPEGPAGLRAGLATLREAAASVSGTTVHLAGPAAAQVDLEDAFAKTDGTLLAVALGGVLVILLLVYRSVLMPLLVIAGALLALAAACAALYALARSGMLPIDGQTQGIVFVLVVGASTDYALLLAARHREELAGQPDAAAAMAAACRATAPPVLSSASIIACAMMTLTLSDLPAERALGPAVAIAMACCAAVSLTFLPALLVLCGPRTLRPRTGRGARGRWTATARTLAHRPRRVWVGCLLLLAAGAACAGLLAPSGVPLHQALPAGAPSVAGHEVLTRHFPAGAASPLAVVAPPAAALDVRNQVAATPGVAASTIAPSGTEGRALVLATLTDTPDSARARETVTRLRASLAGTGALVGGQSAQHADLQEASVRGQWLITPLVLIVVLVLLLRCLLLPVLLVAAAWASLFTAFGAAALVFRLATGASVTEPAVMLFSFVFLVALGVDYNIFLVHRIRSEAVRHGTAAGVRTGLQTTSGVISAAGLILAATFATLTVMPLLYLAQIGCIVAIGVLIDTLLVRLFLVPALILDLGHRIWWPTLLPGDRPRTGTTPAPDPHVGHQGRPEVCGPTS